MKHKIVYIFSLFLITVLNVGGQNSIATNKDYSTNPPDFTKLHSYKEMNVALDAVVRLHPIVTLGFVSNLVNQIRLKDASDEARVYAIYLLGELKVTNMLAIEVLIDKINLKAPRLEPALRIRLWGDYPAAEALEKIGPPAVSPILSRLPDENNEVRRHLMCCVLNKIEGKDAAQSQIRQKLSHMLSETVTQANLESALKELDK